MLDFSARQRTLKRDIANLEADELPPLFSGTHIPEGMLPSTLAWVEERTKALASQEESTNIQKQIKEVGKKRQLDKPPSIPESGNIGMDREERIKSVLDEIEELERQCEEYKKSIVALQVDEITQSHETMKQLQLVKDRARTDDASVESTHENVIRSQQRKLEAQRAVRLAGQEYYRLLENIGKMEKRKQELLKSNATLKECVAHAEIEVMEIDTMASFRFPAGILCVPWLPGCGDELDAAKATFKPFSPTMNDDERWRLIISESLLNERPISHIILKVTNW